MTNAPERRRGAYERAILALSRRDHSEEEIRRRLEGEGFPNSEVEGALVRLRRQGALNDRAFAERFATSRLAQKGEGRRRIKARLAGKGLRSELIDAGLQAALEEVSEADGLDAVALRYYRSQGDAPPRLRVQKLWAFLLRRGFPPGLVEERLLALFPRFRDALEGLEAETEE